MKIEVGDFIIMTSVPPGGSPPHNPKNTLATTSVPPNTGRGDTSVPPGGGTAPTSVPPGGGIASLRASSLSASERATNTSVPPIGVYAVDPMRLVRVRIEQREGRLFVFLDGEKIG